MTEERRQTTLTEQDIINLVNSLTKPIADELVKPENIDKFAANFELRWRDYFYKGLGKGVFGYARKGLVLLVVYLTGYGMAHNWNWPWK